MTRRITRKRYGHNEVRNWRKNKERLEKSMEDSTPEDRKGYVYIFKLYDGFYKIGHTTNVEQRMKSLSASCPTLNCVWSARVKDRFAAEIKLHKIFKKKKVNREVFELLPKDWMIADQAVNKYR